MAGGIQMMDLVSHAKHLTQLRGTDPAQQAASQRQAATAAALELEALHHEVEESEHTRRAKLKERRDGQGGREHAHERPTHGPEEEPHEPVPEQNEGHLLDLKA